MDRPRRHDVVTDSAGQLIDAQIAVEAVNEMPTYAREQFRAALHDAAAKNQPPGPCCQHQSVRELTQRVGDELPCRVRGAQVGGRNPCTCRDRRTRGKTFDTIPVIRAMAGPCIPGNPGDAHVPQLGVIATKHRLARNDEPDSDPGTDGDIGKVVEPACGSPPSLRERRRVDVRIDFHWNAPSLSEPPEHIGSVPAGFRTGDDVAEAA